MPPGSNRAGAGRALQHALLDAIDALRPERGGRARGHALLTLRYVEGMEARAVQARLGIARAEYFREQTRAIAAVAALLRERWGAEPPAPRPEPVWSTADTAGLLPTPLSTFVGREREIAEVARLLLRTRLLTVTGPGGVGKTRLSLRVAAEVHGHFPDGTRFVDLARLGVPGGFVEGPSVEVVAQNVAAGLGFGERAGEDVLTTLIGHLGTRRVLLVVDNCEHVIDSCARLVAALVGACPGVVVLATSREPLQVAGEQTWRLGALTFPPAAAGPTSDRDALGRYEAVRLFVDRAAAVRPDFALTDENADAVGRICRQLDGIPLAIELAAARAGLLGPVQIAERLDEEPGLVGARFRLLAGGTRTAPPRHRTLRAVLDWSHRLLDDGERRLFRRLAIFAGGCTIEAAEAVCADDDLDTEAVLETLGRLVDKSLVLAEHVGGRARYTMLETVRVYACERLAEGGDEPAVRSAHAAYMLGLVEAADRSLRGREQRAWLDRLEREHANVRVAFNFVSAAAEADAALRIVGALHWFWVFGGRLAEGISWAAEAVALPGAAGSARCAGALATAASLLFMSGDVDRAAAMASEASTAAGRSGDGVSLIRARHVQARAAQARGQGTLARALHSENLSEARRLDSPPDEAVALYWLAQDTRRRGDLPAAQTLAEACLNASRGTGDGWTMGYALTELGHIAVAAGDLASAKRHYRESLAAFEHMGSRAGVANVQDFLAAIMVDRGELAQAWDLQAASLRSLVESGLSGHAARALAGMAVLAAALGHASKGVVLAAAAKKAQAATIGDAGFEDQPLARVERVFAAGRLTLDDQVMARLLREGRRMPLHEAAAYALEPFAISSR